VEENIFENWVNEYTETLYLWAFYKTSHKEVAEDLVQETFLNAFEGIGKFSGKSSPKTWLFSILSNKINDFYRKTSSKVFPISKDFSEQEATEVTESFFDANGNWSSAPKMIFSKEEANLLDDPKFLEIFDFCLEDLPENWKHAVRGKYIFEKKSSEICHDLNINATNYWQILHRAKLFLRKCIENNWV